MEEGLKDKYFWQQNQLSYKSQLRNKQPSLVYRIALTLKEQSDVTKEYYDERKDDYYD